MDENGLHDVRIIASSSLDEYSIRDLVAAGAPIDAFGVGTRLGTVADMPYLDSVYKLVEYDGEPRMKLSADKSNYPCRKQVYRLYEDGIAQRDVVATLDERLEGEPLLERVMENGVRTEAGRRTLDAARTHANDAVNRLPERLHTLERASEPYAVDVSPLLRSRTEDLTRRLRKA